MDIVYYHSHTVPSMDKPQLTTHTLNVFMHPNITSKVHTHTPPPPHAHSPTSGYTPTLPYQTHLVLVQSEVPSVSLWVWPHLGAH